MEQRILLYLSGDESPTFVRWQLSDCEMCSGGRSNDYLNMTYAEYLDCLDSQYSNDDFENVALLLKSKRGLILSDKRLWNLMHGIIDDIILIKYCIFILKKDFPPKVVNF